MKKNAIFSETPCILDITSKQCRNFTTQDDQHKELVCGHEERGVNHDFQGQGILKYTQIFI